MTNQVNSKAVDSSVDKDQLNYLNAMHNAPAVRLDAEFYQADDIDADADGLSGSGNLNYLVLQSQQTHDDTALNNPFRIMEGDNLFNGVMIGAGGTTSDSGNLHYGSFSDDDTGTDLGNSAGNFVLSTTGNTGQDIPALGTGLSVTGASALKASSFSEGSSFSEQTNIEVTNNPPPTIPEGPEKPEPPLDPKDPPNKPGSDDYDLVVDVDTPILDIDLDVILDPVEAIVGDIDIDIDTIINNILPGDHGLLPDISASVDAILEGTTLLDVDLDELIDPLDPVVSNVTDLLDNLIIGVEGLLPATLIQPVTDIFNTVVDLTGLNGGAGDTDLILNLGSVIPGFTALDTALNIPLSPVELLLGDIDITADAQVLLQNLSNGNIIPDLGLGLDVATDILPDFSSDIASGDILNFVTGTIAEITEGLPVGDLLGNNLGEEALESLLGNDLSPIDDTDLTIDTGIELVGIEVPDINVDIPLDIVEFIIGDIDINLDVASLTTPESVSDILHDALSGDIDGIVDNLNTDVGLDTHLDILSGNDIHLDVFPDNLGDIATNTGNLTEGLGEAVGNLLGASQIPDVLPDPVGTITQGLTHVVDTTPVLGGLGGLLHHGGGGLFG